MNEEKLVKLIRGFAEGLYANPFGDDYEFTTLFRVRLKELANYIKDEHESVGEESDSRCDDLDSLRDELHHLTRASVSVLRQYENRNGKVSRDALAYLAESLHI